MTNADTTDLRPLTATYRMQLHAGFTCEDALAVLPYVEALGASHVYLSPVLTAVPGSEHGYDVLDHTTINPEIGGREGLERLAADAHARGMGVIVDVVPNHMALVSPLWRNAPLWGVLREGRHSAHAHWFDVDWDHLGGRFGLPVLGQPLADALAAGEITVGTGRQDEGPAVGQPVVRYFEHVLPIAPETEHLAERDDLSALLDAQHWVLGHWLDSAELLNYRRFFEVDGLVGVRVEEPDVFEATHAELLDLHHRGVIDGFRIDHPDGLHDPQGYLDQLAAATRPGTPVWVEKILEGQERLPLAWACAGTTGYDANAALLAALVDPTTVEDVSSAWFATGGEPDLEVEVERCKRLAVDLLLQPELERLVRRAREVLPEHDEHRLRAALVEALVSVDVYRAYIRPGEQPGGESDRLAAPLREGLAHAREARPDLDAELEALGRVLLDPEGCGADRAAATDLCVRFQQTTGPVMAKGIEDTAFYRWHRLVALNEVGADPSAGERPDEAVAALHTWAANQAEHWPLGLTTLSTHDTKRSEDVRARILAVAGDGEAWRRLGAVGAAAAQRHGVDAPTAHLVWQTLVGAGRVSEDRLRDYLTKAVREAKVHSSWTEPDEDYESRVQSLAHEMVSGGEVGEAIAAAVSDNRLTIGTVTLAQKILQLTLPGVPDTYQAAGVIDLSLVDPDNRRPVDYQERVDRLRRLDATGWPTDLADEALWVTSRVLRLRSWLPQAYGPDASYEPVDAGPHVLGFLRGGVAATLTIRAPRALGAAGGLGETRVRLPADTWVDALTGAEHEVEDEGEGRGSVRALDVFADRPVALLVRARDLREGPESAAREDARGMYDVGAARPPHSFGLWAPEAQTVELLGGDADSGLRMSMVRGEHFDEAGHPRTGWWELDGVDTQPFGGRYAFSVDGGIPVPDPRSRRQPEGVHAFSELIDTSGFHWGDGRWRGVLLEGAAVYELHVGTFTADGTFDAAVERLDHLVDLGVSVVELMPVASFPGRVGWGYDGVALYAVHEAYGGPEGLARFVDAAHARGLAVWLDVVYNHLGPSGNYLAMVGPYFTDRHHTPWGEAVNLDGPHSDGVRAFLLDNVRMWLEDYHLDGLRLDAVHALHDERAVDVLEEMAALADEIGEQTGIPRTLVAESDRNDPATVAPRGPGGSGGTGLHGQWADDVHHALHVLLTGETQGYYGDFATPEVLPDVLGRSPFRHEGTFSTFRGRRHGRPVDPEVTPGWRYVASLQTHDQVGNRATGDRVHHTISPGRHAIGAALLLTSPYTPMLFMGEEWAASTPWQYFTDHEEEWLAESIRQGRQTEFAEHGWSGQVPDPQDAATAASSVLRWDEVGQPGHAEMLDLYRDLLRLRRSEPGLASTPLGAGEVCREPADGGGGGEVVTVVRGEVRVVCSLGASGRTTVPLGGEVTLLTGFGDVAVAGGSVEVGPDSVAVVRVGGVSRPGREESA